MANGDFITTLGKALQAYVDAQDAMVSAAQEAHNRVAEQTDTGAATTEGGQNGPVPPVGGSPK